MTVIAVIAARDMRRVLAGGSDAVVAGAATPDYLGVIDYHHGLPHIRGVAVFTDVRRQGVCRALTRCVRAVMAVYAVSRDGRVIEGCRQPGDRRVAVIAGVAA